MSDQPQLNAIVSKGVLLAMLLANSLRLCAQSDQIIQGRFVDAATGRPLPFVTLSVADGQVSNETNAEGYFRLNVPKQFTQDTLTLMAVNYQLTQRPLMELTPTDSIFRLNAILFQAQASTTDTYFSLERSFQVRDTLLKAVAAIAKNYSGRPTLLHGFYRETIREQQNDLCVSYAEGLLDIYKPSYYFPKKDDQIHFIKGRRKPLTTYTVSVLTPGPWACTMLDIVKYQDFLFRNGKLNENYAFDLAGRTVIGDQPVYGIDFKPRSPSVAGGYFTGKLFLTMGSLAIIRAEYELTEQGLSFLNRSQYAQVYSTNLQKRKYVVSYTKFANRWSFQSGSVENTFTFNSTATPFQSRVDFVVTRRRVENVKSFRANEQVNFVKMPMQSFDKTSTTFWDGENQLLPTYPLPPLITGSTHP